MKLTLIVPIGLATVALGSLAIVSEGMRAIPKTVHSLDSNPSLSTNITQLCLKEAHRRNLRRPLVGADYSTTTGFVEIDTARETFSCQIRGRRVKLIPQKGFGGSEKLKREVLASPVFGKIASTL